MKTDGVGKRQRGKRRIGREKWMGRDKNEWIEARGEWKREKEIGKGGGKMYGCRERG